MEKGLFTKVFGFLGYSGGNLDKSIFSTGHVEVSAHVSKQQLLNCMLSQKQPMGALGMWFQQMVLPLRMLNFNYKSNH